MTTTFAELGGTTIVVTPGVETTTTLNVRNDSDIVEAYEFEVLGECAPWTTVEPLRLSLYPGTAQNVTVRLRPPRSPEITAGEKPLGIRVMPVERPETQTVSESTVIVEPFLRTEPELTPRRRRAWRGARYTVSLTNLSNTPVTVAPTAADTEAQLRFTFPSETPEIEPGMVELIRFRARTRKLIWFGKPVSRPFRVKVDSVATLAAATPLTEQHDLDGELLQQPLLPKWLLAVLAALLALILAWFALVRPAIRSAAIQAAAQQISQNPQPPNQRPPVAAHPGSGGSGSGSGNAGGGGGGASSAKPPPPAPTSQQSSATIQVRTNQGGTGRGGYTVPAGRTFRITDILLANPQGDEGLLTIVFGRQTITTIALETFRNQDYHWLTPIDVPAGATVSATVTCDKPGTPATGVQAPNCLQLLNVSGDLVG
ncbi:MAG TPA: hydrolytic protein [Pseudonocardiaceae bacterium]|nr:hydrolytic protein [Pseudonocardiaceae bacterium]